MKRGRRKLELVQPAIVEPKIPRTPSEKLEAALQTLGDRWLLSKANAVKRLKTPRDSWGK